MKKIRDGERMFGYLRPFKDELKVREYELYKSVYCGLCRHLGRDYGWISRLTLSYDCTVLAMLAIDVRKEKSCVIKGRCVCNPLKKCRFCDSEGQAFVFAGAVSVIMTYYKLQDTIQDSGFWKKTAAKVLQLLVRHSFHKAAKAYPAIAKRVSDMMVQQSEAEQTDCGIDRAAEPSAKALSDICKMLSDDEGTKKILSVFGYFVGRWIYIMDATDDLEKDIKSHSFNPFKAKFTGNIHETMLYCNEVLNMTVSELILAYELLELSEYQEILDNLVYHGLSFQQKHCLFDKKEKKGENV